MLGVFAASRFAFDEAAKVSAKLRGINPDHLLATIIDATAHLTQKDAQGARAIVEPALAQYPNHRELLSLFAAVEALSHNEKQLENVLKHYDKVTGNNPMALVTDEIFKPNGLCFSPDYKKLYVADTGATHYPDAPRVIKVWDVVDSKKLANGKQFCSMEWPGKGAGLADGIRADIDGNVWASAGWVGDGYDGVHIFAPDGVRIGQILLPEICSNVCFGGAKRNRLFMTGSQSLYSVYVETQGAHIT